MIDWDKEYPIAMLTRAQLKLVGFGEGIIEKLTDEDMQRIAAHIAEVYNYSQFQPYMDFNFVVDLAHRRPMPVDPSMAYPVIVLSLDDLRDAGFTQAQIASITDADMRAIASRLEDAIRDDTFSEQVYIAATMVMEWGIQEEL